MARVADTVAATLHAHGIRHAFGVPGGEVVTLIDGLAAAGIAFHLARHETAAAVMAAGASVSTKTPGLLVTTLGPGLANAVNGIADAAQEHVPLVVMSGVVERPLRGRYTHQVIDHQALLRPLVKASFEIEPETAGPTVARALALALAEPMGPVHLDLSPATAACPDPDPRIVPPTMRLSPRLCQEDPVITGLAGRLADAERPLILAGFEAARNGCGPLLVEIAERIGAPVVTTYKAKGILPEDHSLALGAAGLSPAADAILLDLVRRADLLLFVGYDPVEMRPGWLDPTLDGGKIVEITAAPADHAMHHAGLRLVAGMAAALGAVSSALRCRREPSRRTWPGGEPEDTRRKLARRFAGNGGWGPHRIIEVLNAGQTEATVVTVDSGAHRILLSQKWLARRPLELLQSAGFCTMAAALPLAIGVKVASPASPVIAVMGDGGLEMGIGELATLRDLDLPVTLVVFQDRSLALIALKQASAGYMSNGVALGETDFAAVARGFGGYGRTVDNADDLRVELAVARTRSRFTLIACRFDAHAYDDAF